MKCEINKHLNIKKYFLPIEYQTKPIRISNCIKKSQHAANA